MMGDLKYTFFKIFLDIIFKFYKLTPQFRKEHIPLIIKAYTRNDSYKNTKNNIF